MEAAHLGSKGTSKPHKRVVQNPMSYTTLAQVSLNSHMHGGYIMTMIEEEKAPNWIIDQLNTWVLTINGQPLTTVSFRSFLS